MLYQKTNKKNTKMESVLKNRI